MIMKILTIIITKLCEFRVLVYIDNRTRVVMYI